MQSENFSSPRLEPSCKISLTNHTRGHHLGQTFKSRCLTSAPDCSLPVGTILTCCSAQKSRRGANKMQNLLPISMCLLLMVGFGQASADKVLIRHARAMMIDMRGTPDIYGECRGAGFFRNSTDCTQFYRCVDFRNNSIYTIFRFMCGPMAVFDESRSLCTGPELAVPPCPADQLQVFLANNMMPMKPTSPPAPRPPAPTNKPIIATLIPFTPTVKPPTSPRPPTPSVPTARPPPPPPPPKPTAKPSVVTSVTTSFATTTVTSVSIVDPVTITSTGQATTITSTLEPATITLSPSVGTLTVTSTAEPSTITLSPSVGTLTVTSTAEPATITLAPSVDTLTVTSVSTVEPATITLTQSADILTVTSVSTLEPSTITIVSTIEPQTITSVSTQELSTVTLTSTIEASTVTVLSTIEQNPVTIVSTIEPSTVTLISTIEPSTVTVTLQPAVVTTTSGPSIVTDPPPTTLEPITETSTITTMPTETITETPAVPTVETPTEPPPPKAPLVGVVPVGCGDSVDQAASTDIAIPPNSLFAFVPSGPNGQLVITEDGSGSSSTFQISPGSFFGITTTTEGGSISSVVNGACANDPTNIVLPAGTTISIYKFDGMVIVLYKTIVVTVTKVTVVISTGVIGQVQFGQQNQVVTIGAATYSIHYITTSSGSAAYGFLQVTNKPSTSLTVATETHTLLDNPESLLGILPIGGSSRSETDIDVPEGSTLGVIPHQGLGTVTVSDGSSTSTFIVQPGSLFSVMAVGGNGKVTAVINQFFTTSLTTITFPAGSVFGVIKVTVGGVIYKIENKFVTTAETTVVVPTQSVVGIIQTLQGWQIIGIGSATFETKYITNVISNGPSISNFIGVLNLSADSSTTGTTTVTSTPETIVGVVKVGDSDTLGVDGEPVKSTTDISVAQGNVLAVIPPEQNVRVTFTEGSASTTLVLPVGTALGVQAGNGNGVVTSVSNGFFTTSSSSITFPAGSTLIVYVIGTGGRVVYQQTLLVTKYVITVTVPAKSTVGVLANANSFNSIGGASFTTEYLTVTSSNDLNAFGVLYAGSHSAGSQQVLTCNTVINGDSNSISGILQVGKPVTSTSVTKLSVPVGSTVAILPAGGRGEIVVKQEDSVNTLTILPGHMIGIKVSVVGGIISGIAQNLLIADSSNIQLPAGTEIHIYRIGVEGQLISIQVLTTTSTCVIVAPVHSIVGFVSLSDSGTLTNIGSASYSTQILTQTLSSSSGSTYFGVLNLSSGSQIITYSSDTVSGMIHVANEQVLFPAPPAKTSTISIPINVPVVILGPEGLAEMVVSEEEASLLNTTKFAINSGSMLIASTSTSAGTATDIANGYLTSQATTFNFPAGGTFGIATVWKNGSIVISHSVTTERKTTITVPLRSTFGFLNVDQGGRVTDIGPASFTTQYVTVASSNSSNFFSSVGVLHFKQDFNAAQSAMVTSVALGRRQTISGIVQIGIGSLTGTDSDTFASTADITATGGSTIGIIPFKGQGLVSVSSSISQCSPTECYETYQPTDFFAVLPGRIFVILVSAGAQGTITNVGNKFFTTTATAMTFDAGTTFGVASIGADGQLLDMESSVTSTSKILVVVPLASTVGLITKESSVIARIGEASFFIRYANSSFAEPSALGILDIESILNPPKPETPTVTPTVTPVTPPPVPPSVPPTAPPRPQPTGAFTIDCSDGLHRYPYDCSRFYQCYGEGDEQTVFVFSCAAGLIFDEATAECTTPAQTTCDVVASNLTSSFGGGFQISCGSDALLRYPLNCNFFYQCFKDEGAETIFVFSCAAGLVFDEASAQCVTPEETLSCAAPENVIKVAPFFQLGQRIDIRPYIPISEQQIAVAAVAHDDKPKLSRLSVDETSQAVVDAVSSLVGKLAKQYSANSQEPAAENSESLPHFFQYRKVQPGTYGSRIVPRMRQLYAQHQEQ